MFTGVGTKLSRPPERVLEFRVLGLYIVAWCDVCGLTLVGSDLYPGIFGRVFGVSLSITVAVIVSAVDISSLVEGALNGLFLCLFRP